jgi:hypothetical protein
MPKKFLSLMLLTTTVLMAAPVLQMNHAFNALTELIPFLADKDKFMAKPNEKLIATKMGELEKAFKSAKHDSLLKQDLFYPSYQVINDNLSGSLKAFNAGKKDYAHWRLREVTSLCLDCHTRLPVEHTSSFQDGQYNLDHSKFDNAYNLGIAQLIVRRYSDARVSFTKSIEDKMLKKDIKDLIKPFKQLLVIETKVAKEPQKILTVLNHYLGKNNLPEDVRNSISNWVKRLEAWKGQKEKLAGLKDDKAVENLITKDLKPLKKVNLSEGSYDVDLLITSGLLSNYLFENPNSKKAPEINYWLGWSEKHLKRENFFGSGDLFLKQCIRRYPSHPVAKDCLEEYTESVEFDFSGSAGTNIPAEVQAELKNLENLIKKK